MLWFCWINRININFVYSILWLTQIWGWFRMAHGNKVQNEIIIWHKNDNKDHDVAQLSVPSTTTSILQLTSRAAVDVYALSYSVLNKCITARVYCLPNEYDPRVRITYKNNNQEPATSWVRTFNILDWEDKRVRLLPTDKRITKCAVCVCVGNDCNGIFAGITAADAAAAVNKVRVFSLMRQNSLRYAINRGRCSAGSIGAVAVSLPIVFIV